MAIKVNSIVRIKPEWCNAGESGKLYRVIECNGDRLLVVPVETTMAIVPQELVSLEHVESAS